MPTSSPDHTADAAAGPLRLVELDAQSDARWDAYVGAHPDGLIFHHSCWLATLHREYGQRPLALAAEAPDGALCGVLPLMATRGLGLPGIHRTYGRRLASLPRTPVAGPIADDRSTLGLLVRGAIERVPEGSSLQLKLDAQDLEGVDGALVGHPWRATFVLDLPAPPQPVRFGNSRNHSRVRWAVNKAHKERVTVRHADAATDVERWYPLYLETMRHHMVPPRPLRLFEAMWDTLRPRGMMRLLLAERDGDLLAGALLVMHGQTVFYLFNGVRRSAFALRPNDVLQWEAIHECAAEGYRRYDFGEVAEDHEGLSDFKRKWGTTERRLHRYYHPAPPHPPDRGHGVTSRPGELAMRAWRYVPLPMTRLAGEYMYRYL